MTRRRPQASPTGCARSCIANALRPACEVPRLGVEPGRAIVGPSGVTVYEVGTVKDVRSTGDSTRSYVSVDGGMSDNIRTALYDAEYTCALANRASHARTRSCPESWASIARAATSSSATTWLPADVGPGDLLAVAATGAYCRSMASNYNHVPRPPVVGVKQGGSDRAGSPGDRGRPAAARRRDRGDRWNSVMSDALRVALLGCGTVGSQVARLMNDQADDLAARIGAAAGARGRRGATAEAASGRAA